MSLIFWQINKKWIHFFRVSTVIIIFSSKVNLIRFVSAFFDCKINPSKYYSNRKFFVRWQKTLRSLNNSSAESPSECFITYICQEKILTKSRKKWQIIANTHNTSAGSAPGYQKVVQVKGQRKLLDLYLVLIKCNYFPVIFYLRIWSNWNMASGLCGDQSRKIYLIRGCYRLHVFSFLFSILFSYLLSKLEWKNPWYAKIGC